MGIRSFLAGSALVQGLTHRDVLPSELFPGAEKPSTTLVKMLIAEMFQNIDAALSSPLDYIGQGKTLRCHAFPSFQLYVHTREEKWNDANPSGTWFYRIELKADKNFSIDDFESKLFSDAVHKWAKLRLNFKQNEVEMNRQQKAVDLIADLFKEKTPCPPPSPSPTSPSQLPTIDISMLDVQPSPKTSGLNAFDAESLTARAEKLLASTSA